MRVKLRDTLLMDKKYQIFVSSTFEDLKDERQEVFKTLIDLGHIPVGMESFPAIDMEQFEYIKKMINTCDYYILIIAGRYGSRAEDGISYTEKEYKYAIEQKIPVLRFKHSNYRDLPANKVENTDEGKTKLDAFIKKTSSSKLKKDYNNKDNLVTQIAISLPQTIRHFPAIGWVRANQVANTEILADINTLRKENDALKTKLSEYENTNIQIDNLADFDDVFEFELQLSGGIDRLRLKKTWCEIFMLIATHLRKGLYKNDIYSMLRKGNYVIIREYLEIILVQLEVFSLIAFSIQQHDDYYTLTEKGKQVMLQTLAVTKTEMAQA